MAHFICIKSILVWKERPWKIATSFGISFFSKKYNFSGHPAGSVSLDPPWEETLSVSVRQRSRDAGIRVREGDREDKWDRQSRHPPPLINETQVARTILACYSATPGPAGARDSGARH